MRCPGKIFASATCSWSTSCSPCFSTAGYTDGEWKHKRALDESLTAGWLSNEFVLNKLRMGDNEAYRKIGDNEFYMPYFKPDRTYPPIFFDDETAEELSFLEADIGNYVESQYAKWVVGGGIDEQWDHYIATLNRMGLERYMEILQQEYDKFTISQLD